MYNYQLLVCSDRSKNFKGDLESIFKSWNQNKREKVLKKFWQYFFSFSEAVHWIISSQQSSDPLARSANSKVYPIVNGCSVYIFQ